MRNVSLDLLKVFASYMVVFIHIKFAGVAGAVVTSFARFAVPLFFMVSGYFSYNNDFNRIKKKAFHIFKIFACSISLYILCYILVLGWESAISENITYYFDWKKFILLIGFHSMNTTDHLWFLLALIYCYIMYGFLCVNKIKHRWCYIASIPLLCIHILMGEFLSVFGISVQTCLVRNFLFMGFPFFMFGIYVRENEKNILKFFSNRKIALFVLSGALESAISVLVLGYNEIHLGTLLIAPALFVLALKMKDIQYNKFFVLLCRCSTYIYVIHILIYRIIDKLIDSLNVSAYTTIWYYSSPIMMCVISTVFALVIDMVVSGLKKKYNPSAK
ncbi:MAG: acyltransferase [Clostridia bacterium]|nr:acyltransferase [Clostridia bacterium]